MVKKIKTKRKTTDNWKKKKWFTIKSPKEWEEKEIAKTPATDEKKVIDRVIKVPLRELTNNIKHQFMKVHFRVKEVKGLTAYTELEGFELIREALKRNVRRRRSMIRTIQDIKTKDNKKIRITAYCLTARKTDTTKKDEIRKIMAEEVQALKKETLDSLTKKCLFGQVAANIAKKVKKISPIKRVEITKGKILRDKQ